MIRILRGWSRRDLFVFASFDFCTMGEEAAAGEPILSGIGLSGSEKEESDSNLLSVSTAAVVSNKDVE